MSKSLKEIKKVNDAKQKVIIGLDTYLLAPFLVWVAFRKKPLSKFEKKLLLTMGVGKILVNAHKYKKLSSQIVGNDDFLLMEIE